MKHLHHNVFLFLLIAISAAAQPTISSVSPSTVARSGRVLIQGAGFGALQGGGHVEIGGVAAPLTRWSDTLIAAYVPESAVIGADNVQVFDAQGASSNLVPVSVTARAAQDGHVLWRFQADGDYIQSRPAVGSDGTIYTADVYGHLYALDPTGGLKWIFNGSGGNISLGQDGTIYVGGTTSIIALAPDGTLKWQFNENPSAFILLGPNVGPDGNIYAVGTQGMGVFSLTPQGTLRWSLSENYDRPIVTLQEIVFSPSGPPRLYFHANRHLRSVGLDGTEVFTYPDALVGGDPQPVVAPDGSLYTDLFEARGPGLMFGKFDSNGNRLWHIFDSSNTLSMPDVGPDGRTYIAQNLTNLHAINSNGTVQWQYSDGYIMFIPVVSPLNDLILVGGVVTYGQPGFFDAVSTNGTSLWKQILPVENGLNIVPMSRARFTLDGQTAYVGTSIAGQSGIGYSYLYAIQTGNGGVSLSSLTLNPTQVRGGSPSTGTLTLSGPAPRGGVTVRVSSNNPILVNVPPSVTIAEGNTTATFTARTRVTLRTAHVTVSAWTQSVLKRATLTVTP